MRYQSRRELEVRHRLIDVDGRVSVASTGLLVVSLSVACALVAPGGATAQSEQLAWKGWSDQEKERFLETAEIVARQVLPRGVTLSSRVTLFDGTVTHDAHLQTIDFYRKRYKTGGRTFLNFHDSYRYNIAAYRLDRLLGLGMVPVSVQREVGGEPAALTWWVDDVLMTLRERYSRSVRPPEIARWNDQRYQARVFNQLIYNSDPNLGNHLIDTDWKLWMVDFTRAFRTFHRLYDEEKLRKIDRRLLIGLRELTEESLEAATGEWLGRRERRAVLKRRDLLLEHFEKRIEVEGEDVVVCARPGH